MRREANLIDRAIGRCDALLRAATRTGLQQQRLTPGADLPELELESDDRRHAAALMRVNHAGEIAAQALYVGQALGARRDSTAAALLAAARDEGDHLHWCEERLAALGSRPSLLAPLWFAGSCAIGIVAGIAGDRASLGFVEETERQVVAHLDEHLGRLPAADRRSRAVVAAMRADEARHAAGAARRGAARPPLLVRRAMAAVARIMTTTAYRF
jgi:ubiquinone biosynthesis monooxygenase Coq7